MPWQCVAARRRKSPTRDSLAFVTDWPLANGSARARTDDHPLLALAALAARYVDRSLIQMLGKRSGAPVVGTLTTRGRSSTATGALGAARQS